MEKRFYLFKPMSLKCNRVHGGKFLLIQIYSCVQQKISLYHVRTASTYSRENHSSPNGTTWIYLDLQPQWGTNSITPGLAQAVQEWG